MKEINILEEDFEYALDYCTKETSEFEQKYKDKHEGGYMIINDEYVCLLINDIILPGISNFVIEENNINLLNNAKEIIDKNPTIKNAITKSDLNLLTNEVKKLDQTQKKDLNELFTNLKTSVGSIQPVNPELNNQLNKLKKILVDANKSQNENKSNQIPWKNGGRILKKTKKYYRKTKISNKKNKIKSNKKSLLTRKRIIKGGSGIIEAVIALLSVPLVLSIICCISKGQLPENYFGCSKKLLKSKIFDSRSKIYETHNSENASENVIQKILCKSATITMKTSLAVFSGALILSVGAISFLAQDTSMLTNILNAIMIVFSDNNNAKVHTDAYTDIEKDKKEETD
jgi:hypothetical protein